MKQAREPASSRSKALCILEKAPRILPVRRSMWPSKEEKLPWSEISFSLRNLPVRAFDSCAQGFSPPLARQRSSCPPPSPNLVCTHPIEIYRALRDSAPCLTRAATLPKATKLELGRGAHLKTPPSANHTAAASQPTDRIAKAASWLHLSRLSPALHPPERPSHTHTPKPGFGGRARDGTLRPIDCCTVTEVQKNSIELVKTVLYSCVYIVCVCVVYVFFPIILCIKFVGRISRGHTGGRSHRISHPPSFCGAWLNFSREKDSAIPFPRRPLSRILYTNDLIILHLLGIICIFIFYFLVRKNPVYRDSNSRPNVSEGYVVTSELPGLPACV